MRAPVCRPMATYLYTQLEDARPMTRTPCSMTYLLWSVEDVVQWLGTIGYDRFGAQFRINGI